MVPELWRPEMERALRAGFAGHLPGTQVSRPQDGEGGLAVPITLRGQTLGVLGVEPAGGGQQWTEDDLALVQAVSEQLAQTLETARLFADTQRTAERERLIGEITSRIRASTDVRAILETTALELGRALGTSRALVRLSTEAPPPGATEGLAGDCTRAAPQEGAPGLASAPHPKIVDRKAMGDEGSEGARGPAGEAGQEERS